MENLSSFLRMFNSYLFVVIIAVIVIAVAITIGINVRKHNNSKVTEDANTSEAEN